MKLHYQITRLLHPHYVKDKGCVYDHICWTVWFSKEDLLKDVNEKFNTSFNLEEKCEVSRELAFKIRDYIWGRKDCFGTYGCDYDRDILNIYDN